VVVEDSGPTRTKEPGKEAGGSWFVFGAGPGGEKKKLLRRLEERRITVSGGQSGPRLLLLSDSVPRSLQPGEVTVDLLTPAPASCTSSFTNGTGTSGNGSGNGVGEEDFLQALLRHETHLLGSAGSAAGSAVRCYFSPANHILYFALTLTGDDQGKDGNDKVTLSVKYHVTWPADQEISISS